MCYYIDMLIVGCDLEIVVLKLIDWFMFVLNVVVLKYVVGELCKMIVVLFIGWFDDEECIYVFVLEWLKVVCELCIYFVIYVFVMGVVFYWYMILLLFYIGLLSFYGVWLYLYFGFM